MLYIAVQQISGEVLELVIAHGLRISHLKKEISKLCCVPPFFQRLLVGVEPAENEQELSAFCNTTDFGDCQLQVTLVILPALPYLERQNAPFTIRVRAMEALSDFAAGSDADLIGTFWTGSNGAISAVRNNLKDRASEVRCAAVRALANIQRKDEDNIATLVHFLPDSSHVSPDQGTVVRALPYRSY